MLDNRGGGGGGGGGYSLYVLDGSYGSKVIDVCQLVCCISLCVICHNGFLINQKSLKIKT